MNKNIFFKKLFVLLILLTTVISFTGLSCYASTDLQRKQKQTRAKINHLRWLENLETNKLYKNQQKLESTVSILVSSKQSYSSTQDRLTNLQGNLSTALTEFSAVDYQMKRRVR